MVTQRFVFLMAAMGLFAAVLVLAACGGSEETSLPETNSASLLAYLEEADYQNNDEWKLFPGSTEKYPGEAPTACC